MHDTVRSKTLIIKLLCSSDRSHLDMHLLNRLLHTRDLAVLLLIVRGQLRHHQLQFLDLCSVGLDLEIGRERRMSDENLRIRLWRVW